MMKKRLTSLVIICTLSKVVLSFSPLLSTSAPPFRLLDYTGNAFKLERLRTQRPHSGVELLTLEQELAQLNRQRQKVLAELDHYESALKKLRNDRIDYLVKLQRLSPKKQGFDDDSRPRSISHVVVAETPFSETAVRSAVKALSWRFLAEIVTYAIAMRFSGSSSVAIKLVGMTCVLKAGVMFLGERIMNQSTFGRANGSDGVSRSFAKALFWRLLAISNMLVMAMFVSKDCFIASKIASTDAVFKTALMYAYERLWSHVQWGKEFGTVDKKMS